MTKTQEPKNIYQKINSVMGKVKYARKESKNQGLKYSYVSHDSVVGLLRDAVQEEGIVILPSIESYGMENSMLMMRLKVSIVNIDIPDDQIVMNFSVPSNSRNGVVDEKTFGSTYSYAFKYALLKTFMIETGEDADAISDESGAYRSSPAAKAVVAPKSSAKITPEQVNSINALGKENPGHLALCLKSLKITDVKDIPAEYFLRLIESFAPRLPQGNAA